MQINALRCGDIVAQEESVPGNDIFNKSDSERSLALGIWEFGGYIKVINVCAFAEFIRLEPSLKENIMVNFSNL